MNPISKLLHPQNNVEEIVILLLKQLGVRTTASTVSEKLQSSPNYPSLLAIKEVSDSYDIENLALRTHDIQAFLQVPENIVVQVKFKNGLSLFGFVFHITKKEVDWHNPLTHSRERISCDQFFKLYTGYAMFFDETHSKDEPDFSRNRKKELTQHLVEILMVFFLPTISVFSFLNRLFEHSEILLQTALLLTLLNIGYAVGLILIFYELNEYTPFLAKICGFSKRTNCSAVLHSDASMFLGIPWSVIGTSYFAGMTCALVVSGLSPFMISTLSWLHLLALPYIVFSLYYQYRVVRQWCPLCLTVLAVILMIFVTSLVGGIYSSKIDLTWNCLATIAVCFCMSFTLLYSLWRLSRLFKVSSHYKYSLARVKYHKEVFRTLLQTGRKIEMPTDDCGIILGNPKGSVHIVKVCNPYCGHCADAQPILQKIVNDHPDVKLQIIFATNPNTPFYKETPIDIFLSHYHNGADMERIMSDWYADPVKDKDKFEQANPVSHRDSAWNKENADRMFKFCEAVKIVGTPTIFINGHELPDYYTIKEMQYCI